MLPSYTGYQASFVYTGLIRCLFCCPLWNWVVMRAFPWMLQKRNYSKIKDCAKRSVAAYICYRVLIDFDFFSFWFAFLFKSYFEYAICIS
jgi:hypothetical protein